MFCVFSVFVFSVRVFRKVSNCICLQGEYYNAFEKDIAVINIYFGDSTAMGSYVENKLGQILIFISCRI